MGWVRPASVVHPQIWGTFKARDVDSDQLVEYRVQDIPEDRFEDAVEHMATYFVRDEPTCRSKNVADDPVSMEEVRTMWRQVLKQRMAVACFKEGSDEIAGLNMLYVSCKDDHKDPQLKGEAFKDVYDAYMYLFDQANLWERYQVTEYLSALGLSVSPKYRGRGLSTEILRARIPIAKACGLRMTSTGFSALGSQIPAAKVGFEDTFVLSYDELAAVNPRYRFENTGAPTYKCMSMVIQ